jgi:RNA polymerase sigma-70 factor (ECF subfamily)
MIDEGADEQALARRAQSGDRDAFRLLMLHHKQALFRYVRRYVAEAEDAYDVVQDSFTAAWLSIARYDPGRPFEIWLRRIALNKCRDFGRRRKAYILVLGTFAVMNCLLRQDSQEQEAARHDADAELDQLQRAIDRLPDSLRDPLILTALERLSHKEAAEILDLKPKAVEVRVYRARKRLAELLSPPPATDGD